MLDKQFIFRCYHCGGDTEITISVPAELTTNAGKIKEEKYCQYCNRLNMIEIPDSWDPNPPVLNDNVFLGYKNGIPIVQGQSIK